MTKRGVSFVVAAVLLILALAFWRSCDMPGQPQPGQMDGWRLLTD